MDWIIISRCVEVYGTSLKCPTVVSMPASIGEKDEWKSVCLDSTDEDCQSLLS